MAAFLLDHNVSAKLAPLLRFQGHVAITAREMNMETARDERILLTAATRALIVVTHNVKDFRLLHDAWLVWSRAWRVAPIHTGILIIPDNHQWSPEQAARAIEALIAPGVIVHNALYEWQSRDGWQRRTLPPD
ncbi:MAG: DUF5615 family PIN-like protein [Thermomicrobia bacterium]|nr:DUF5615 family PIN-like protein [Thermomicrobia bacterium]